MIDKDGRGRSRIRPPWPGVDSHRTTITGQWAWWATQSPVEPSSVVTEEVAAVSDHDQVVGVRVGVVADRLGGVPWDEVARSLTMAIWFRIRGHERQCSRTHARRRVGHLFPAHNRRLLRYSSSLSVKVAIGGW
jgi:hypothetical protein